MSAAAAEPAYRDRTLPVAKRVADLLERMTLEEKVAQIYCPGRVVEMTGLLVDADGNILSGAMAELFRHGLCQLGRPAQRRSPRASAELTNAIQRYLVEETRLGIPALFNEEGVHGLMATGATSFPQAIALASTWDEQLVEEVYTVVAREARVRGSNYVYAPVLDLARDPRWGRVEETFGEDPFLASRLGVAAVRGLQGPGPGIGEDRVLACAKHYAVHGQPEGGLNAAPASISERIIREEFLPPFRAVVEEGVQAVMASYNEVDGIPVHANRWLLREVLREEWGFEGFVTSDGFGVPQLAVLHHAAADTDEAARRAIEAGVDCEVPAGVCFPSLLAQAMAGKLSSREMSAIDRAARNVLRAKIRLGLLDELPLADPDEAERVTNCADHRRLALQAARQAIVLLKNEKQLLPLDPAAIGSIAVIGPNAGDLHLGGYAEDPQRGSSILEGIRGKLGDKVGYAEGCRITEGVQGYAAWHGDEVRLSDPADDTPRIAEAIELARRSDVAVLALGGNEGTCREGWWFNHLGDRDDLDLLGRQQELAEAVLATGTPTVVILINGRPLTIDQIAKRVPAILECWYLGQETGTAVAEVLFGEVNPSGKLPVTFPRRVGQLPVYYYHRPSAKRGYAFAASKPLYPFGHGLSYTTFAYHAPRLSPLKIAVDGTARVAVEVTNTGDREGAEIVQLYVRDQLGSVTRPVKALKGFRRIALAPGETRTVEFQITPEALALLDADMRWRVEPGLFDVMVGGSSERLETVTLEVVA